VKVIIGDLKVRTLAPTGGERRIVSRKVAELGEQGRSTVRLSS
jgi:hypothetical protein